MATDLVEVAAREHGAIVNIAATEDIITARQGSRDLAVALGFGTTDQALIAAAVSELARNVLKYAGGGEIRLETCRDGERPGIRVTASDHGPGIANLDDAMRDGFTTSGGLGLGLPGTKRLMDELRVETGPHGTTVTTSKFVPPDA